MYKFDLSQEEAEKIFKEMIIPQTTATIKPSLKKEAFILGGQPGSGKSAFAREILKTNQNMVFINGDDLRAYHPQYYFYLKDNDIEAADLTQTVCNFWIEELVNECIKKNLNFIIEGTMRKIEGPLKTAQEASRNGYVLNLAVISTPYELSLFSLDYRYREVKKISGFARYTKKESHDEAYRNIENTLQKLSDSRLFEKFFIYKRFAGGFEEYIFSASEKEALLKTFREGRERLVDEKEKEILKFKNNFNTEIKIKK